MEIQKVYKLIIKFTMEQQKSVTGELSNQRRNIVGTCPAYIETYYKAVFIKLNQLSYC